MLTNVFQNVIINKQQARAKKHNKKTLKKYKKYIDKSFKKCYDKKVPSNRQKIKNKKEKLVKNLQLNYHKIANY